MDARYVSHVKASCLEEAQKKANAEFNDADFGEAEDIDGEQISVEDEDGNFLWEND